MSSFQNKLPPSAWWALHPDKPLPGHSTEPSATQPMQDRIANDAANVATAHGMLGQLCAVVWLQDGHMMCLAPKGHDEAAALMLYQAADAFAERACNKESHRKVRRECDGDRT